MEPPYPIEVDMLVNDLVELGELIRRRRAELSLSQTDLAEQIGTTRQWVSRLEKGKNDVGTARLLAVLDALELNLEIRPPQLDSSAKVVSEGTWRQSLIASDTVGALLHMRKESTGLSARTASVDPGELAAGRRRILEASLKLTQRRAAGNTNTIPDTNTNTKPVPDDA